MLTEEKTLIKISLVLSIIGLGVLIVLGKSPIDGITQISSINDGLLNSNIKVVGTISSIKSLPSVEIMKVKDSTGTIDIVAYRSDTIDISNGDEVEIEGKISKYKENLQIEAKRIRVL